MSNPGGGAGPTTQPQSQQQPHLASSPPSASASTSPSAPASQPQPQPAQAQTIVHRATQYVHYNPHPQQQQQQQQQQQHAPVYPHAHPQTVSPHDTLQHLAHQPAYGGTAGMGVLVPTATATATATSKQPVVATGNWSRDLVQQAKTAELKKHALTLQLHTAHILSAHASYEQKTKTMEEITEQKNRLESERLRLIESLSKITDDRNQADMLLSSLTRETAALRTKLGALTTAESEYVRTKADVDRLRVELGQSPLPGLAETLRERGMGVGALGDAYGPAMGHQQSGNGAVAKRKRGACDVFVCLFLMLGEATASAAPTTGEAPVKRPRGRPKGSGTKNKTPAGGPDVT